MHKYTNWLLFSILLIACQGKKEQNGAAMAALAYDSLTAALQDIQQAGPITGFGVAIVGPSGVAYAQGFGMADTQKGVPYSANTVQNIASISKTFIGIALMKAQAMGLLNLDDPISRYLPFTVRNPYYPNEKITIRHLATHTSTIKDTDFYNKHAYVLHHAADTAKARGIPASKDFSPPQARVPMGEFLENCLHEDGPWYQPDGFLRQKPGERYEYTNVGATLAAYIVEIATGQAYHLFTSKHIFKPLGMASSGWSFGAIDTTRHTQLYADGGVALPWYSLVTYPDGGLLTSIADMGRYLAELIRGYGEAGTLLAPAGYQEIFEPQLGDGHFGERDTDNPYDDEYNAGIFMGFTPGGYIGHMGGDPGVSTFMFFDPGTKTGRLLFVNSELDKAGVKQFYAIWDKLGEYAKHPGGQ